MTRAIPANSVRLTNWNWGDLMTGDDGFDSDSDTDQTGQDLDQDRASGEDRETSDLSGSDAAEIPTGEKHVDEAPSGPDVGRPVVHDTDNTDDTAVLADVLRDSNRPSKRPAMGLSVPQARVFDSAALLRGGLIVCATTWVVAILGSLVGADSSESGGCNGTAGLLLIAVFAAVVGTVGYRVAGWAPADPLRNAALAGAAGFALAGVTGLAVGAARGVSVDTAAVVGVLYYALFTAVIATAGAFLHARRLRQREREEMGR